jgi:hypothetical protein
MNRKVLLGSGIAIYLLYGLCRPFFGLAAEDFYKPLQQPNEFYGAINNSLDFSNRIAIVKNDQISMLNSCLQNSHRKLRSLGFNELDRTLYIKLGSELYDYELGIKWRVSKKLAYVVGREVRVDKLANENQEVRDIGTVGGECLHDFLVEVLQRRVS